MPPNPDEQIRLLSRRCERILTEHDLRKKMARSAQSGKPLRIKLGMDPTAADVTLGHAVPLRVIRQFQEWGHKAVLIIGDYTARVGDPTGRNKTRPQLTGEEIDQNAKTYVAQVGKILLTDPEHLEIRYNGEWLAKMGLVDLIRLASRKTVAQVLARDDFAKRYAGAIDIRLHEILYPLLQGWDSVMIDADVEMGGSDQLFNNLVGREFQQEEGKEGQVVIVTPLLIGTDGKDKMSKSKGNYIAVTDPPGGQSGMFGKIMRLPDELMDSYYTLLTDIPSDEFRPLIQSNPRDAKVRLAKEIISWLHDSQAEEEWDRVHKGLGTPDDIEEFSIVDAQILLNKLLVRLKLAASITEARQKIREGAVRINGEKITDALTPIVPLRGGIESPDVAGEARKFYVPFVVQLGRKYAKVI
jgi:tyrosyl-tRNA synthetase